MRIRPDLEDLKNKIYDLKIRRLIIKKNYKKYTYNIEKELESIQYKLSEYTYQYLLAGGNPSEID